MKDEEKGLSIIVPAYNEEESIAKVIIGLHSVIKRIKGIEYEIIVVDDGSTDDTVNKVSGLDIKLLRHPKNLGYGKSIMTGIQNAKYSLIAIIDADGTYEPEDLCKMLPLMDTFDMVVGTRDMSRIRQSVTVRILRVILKGIIFYFTEYRSPDPNSGFRIFKKKLFPEDNKLFSLKFSFSTSLTLFALITHRFVNYVPIKYYPRSGFSKIRHVRDSVRTLMLIISMALFYRPLRLFIAYAIASTFIFIVIMLSKPLFDIHAWISLNIIWASIVFLGGLGMISFILSQIYETLQLKE